MAGSPEAIKECAELKIPQSIDSLIELPHVQECDATDDAGSNSAGQIN